MTLTGWNCQQGHEHASAVDSMRCNDAHAALKAMEATVQALTAENEALRVEVARMNARSLEREVDAKLRAWTERMIAEVNEAQP